MPLTSSLLHYPDCITDRENLQSTKVLIGLNVFTEAYMITIDNFHRLVGGERRRDGAMHIGSVVPETAQRADVGIGSYE